MFNPNTKLIIYTVCFLENISLLLSSCTWLQAQDLFLIPGCIYRDIISREVQTWSSSSTQCLSDHICKYCVQFWSPQFKKDMDWWDRVQRGQTKRNRRVENLPREERLEESSLLIWEKMAQKGTHHSIPAFKVWLQRGWNLSPHKGPHGKVKGQE